MKRKTKDVIAIIIYTICICLGFGGLYAAGRKWMNKPEIKIRYGIEDIRNPDWIYKQTIEEQKTDMCSSQEEDDEVDVIRVSNSQEWDNVYLLAQLIQAEVGSVKDDNCLYACGSVVINRTMSDNYPDSIRDVIYQKGQYACVGNGSINNTPNDRCIEIATDLIYGGATIPRGVVYQAEFKQGKVWKQYDNQYFCYN